VAAKSVVNDYYHKKEILITGGLGMIGSNVAQKLVRLGARITIVDACLEPYGANIFNLHGIEDEIKVNYADIRDRAAMKVLVQGKDVIFNFAGQVSHNDSIADPFLDADINYLGHLNVLESVRKYNPTARVLLSGSRLQFGKITHTPTDENHPQNPETPYAFNKTTAENMYKYYYKLHGVPCVVFRLANPYGIRCQMKHSKYSIINYFIRLAMEGKEITIYGSGNQLRDYVYVEDVADAFISAAASPSAQGEVFNIGSGSGISFKEMVETVITIVGKGKMVFVPWPKEYIDVETGDYVTNIGKAKKVLKWTPKVDLESGIKRTVGYYEKHHKYYF